MAEVEEVQVDLDHAGYLTAVQMKTEMRVASVGVAILILQGCRVFRWNRDRVVAVMVRVEDNGTDRMVVNVMMVTHGVE